jgi:peptidoglycan/LPS O-acetylase OafA/YrhL
VMLYHLGLLPLTFGTYGVYAFFILSGFALEHVYRGRLDVRQFVVARIARLAPLWVAVVLVSVWVISAPTPFIFLNLTGLFGILPGLTSIPSGGWSIGIEVCCYALFPLLTRLSTSRLLALTVATYALRAAWVWTVMPPGVSLVDAWVAYTVLPSFLVFFTLGMVLARVGETKPWSGRPARLATLLGDLSYGTYLLHPLVLHFTRSAAATIAMTPLIALLLTRFYEVPLGQWLRRVARAPRPTLSGYARRLPLRLT